MKMSALGGGGRLLHLVLTRFNLRIRGFEEDKRGQPVRTPAWTRERIELFERFCFPSLLHQTERDFRWLLLLDDESGDPVVRRVEAWRRALPSLEPVWLPSVRDDADMASAILERVADDVETLVTTRLDNDDGLHESALSRIRSRVRPDRLELINLRLGFVTDGRRARVTSHRYSPFVTFVEPRSAGPFRTVHAGLPHGRLRHLAPVRQIRSEPLWLRVIHARNAANTAFEERRSFDLTSPRQLHAWFRHRVARRVRRLAWPREWRRTWRLEEVAGAFHVGETPPLEEARAPEP